jgi:flagellar hook-length control protein FliK
MAKSSDPDVKTGDESKLPSGEDKITPDDDAASQNKFKSEIAEIEAQLQENLQEKATQVVLNQKTIQSGNAILEAEQTAGKMAILGELSDKNKLEQKNNAQAGDTRIEELSFSLISGSDTGSKNIDKTNDISPEGIINQITSELKGNAVSDGSRVRITLNPPSLGTLEMDVTVRNNRVEIVIVADNKDVQQILNNHIDQLKGSLQTQGLKIERCDVLMQGNREDYRQNLGQHAFHHNGSGEGSNRRQDNSEKNFKLNVKATAKHQDNVLKASTDNISLFA